MARLAELHRCLYEIDLAQLVQSSKRKLGLSGKY